MLTGKQVEFYRANGFLRVPKVFTPAQTDELAGEMDWLIATWATKNQGWTGDWRKVYMDPKTNRRSKLVAMHDLQLYSEAWARAVVNPRLLGALRDLLGPNIELHHTTMHVKPPETGHPFPMHQDHPFYAHKDGRYVDVLVHLDDTSHENGEIRFLAGSHKRGPLKHVTESGGEPCAPHLPTDKYRLEDTAAAPAKRGDVVLFNLFTVHGSYINRTDRPRRLVRMGYRDPENRQLGGQSMGRPGWLVCGRRARGRGAKAFSTEVG